MKAILIRLMNSALIVICIALVVELKTFEGNPASQTISDFVQFNSKPDDFLSSIKKANLGVIKTNKNTPKYSTMYNQLVSVLSSKDRTPQDLKRIQLIILANQAEFQLLLDQH
jgi:hypothetical protein